MWNFVYPYGEEEPMEGGFYEEITQSYFYVKDNLAALRMMAWAKMRKNKGTAIN